MINDKDLGPEYGATNGKTMNLTTKAMPVRVGWFRAWPHWTPYAAVAWSLVYAGLGLYWAVSGRGIPFAPTLGESVTGALAGRLGPFAARIIVSMSGLPAAALGAAMLRGVRSRALRPIFISAGAVLTGLLLLCMSDLTLLEMLGYIPYATIGLITGARVGQIYLQTMSQIKWIVAYQLFCIIGGFLWLAGTISYARRSSDACLYCGRRHGSEGWTGPRKAARWGRIAVYVAVVAPIFYAFTRYAWALGFPLGMSQEYLRQGQIRGLWTSGLFLATFGLVGVVLMLGLVQHWGEIFPRWMIGLAGRRVPIALAVVPAGIVSVLLTVGGISIWSGYAQLARNALATGQEMLIVVGPTLLFPLWGVALAVAALGYYYRRRGRCNICGLGA